MTRSTLVAFLLIPAALFLWEIVLEETLLRPAVTSGPSPPPEPMDLPSPGGEEFQRRSGYLFPLGRMGFDRWRPVLDKLEGGKEEVTILVVGGSETAGGDCEDGDRKARECAWPARYERLLRARFPSAKLTLYNYGVGGTTTASAVPLVPSWFRHFASSGGVDLLIADFTVNDCFELQPRHERLAGAYEAFIRAVHGASPGTALAFFHTISLAKCAHVRHAANHAAARYGDSVISYADFSIFLEEGWTAPRRFWITQWFESHPTAAIHQLMAETLHWATGAILNQTAAAAAGDSFTVTRPDVLAKYPSCTTAVSFYSALSPPAEWYARRGDGAAAAESEMGAGWALTEDRPGKPGWIFDPAAARTAGANQSSISFLVTFGETPKLMVTYLRSYTGLGNALLSADEIPGKAIPLVGLYDPEREGQQKVSQNYLAKFDMSWDMIQLGYGVAGVYGLGIKPGATHRIRIAADGKFKIISVSSC
jgi:hypothetical protein